MTQDLDRLSPLAQRLYRRSLASAGVVNLNPSSIDRTSATIQRMVQRELLPSQIESRYQTAGVRASLELPGRSRVETLDRFAPSLETSLRSPMLQRSADEMFDDPIGQTPKWSTSPEATVSIPSAHTFRVSRSPTSEAVAVPVINMSTSADETPAATVTESTTAQERVRVLHPRSALLPPGNESETALLMAKPSVPNSIDPTPPNDPTTPISDRLSPQIDASSAPAGDRISPSVSSLPSISIDMSNDRLPLLARFPDPESSTTAAANLGKSVATDDLPRIKVASGGILPSSTVPMAIAANAQPLVIAKFPVTPRSIGENTMLQAQGLTSVETPAVKQTTVMIQPLSQRQFESGSSSILRRQTVPESVVGVRVASRTEASPNGNRSPLPLHTQIPINTIVRQTEPMGESISVPTPAMPPPPPPTDRSATEVEPNLNQITDRVSQLLARQLVIERERRGMQRW